MRVKTVIKDKVAGGGRNLLRDNYVLVLIDKKYPKFMRAEIRYHEIREAKYRLEGDKIVTAHRKANIDEKKKYGIKAFNNSVIMTKRITRLNG